MMALSEEMGSKLNPGGWPGEKSRKLCMIELFHLEN